MWLQTITAIVAFNLLGCFSQDVNIIQKYCPEVGVEVGSDLSLTCSRVCINGIFSRWQLIKAISPDIRYTVGLDGHPQGLVDKKLFENDVGVNLTLSDDTCTEGETFSFNLTIHNANKKLDQLSVQCGFSMLNVSWSTTASPATIFVERPITQTVYKRTVMEGGSITFTCTRPCGVPAEWNIDLPSEEDGYIVSNPRIRNKFQDATGVDIDMTNLGPTNCSLVQRDLTPYSLSMYNVNQNVSGANVSCGLQQPCDFDRRWFAPHVEQVLIETFDPQVTPASTLSEFTRPPESNISFNCTRLCGPNIYDTWSLNLNNNIEFIVNSDPSSVTERMGFIFSNDSNLVLYNHEFDSCNDERIKYSLQIYNITKHLSGLIMTCGAINNLTNEQWTASHSVQLKIDECENVVVEFMQIVDELNGTIQKQSSDLTAYKVCVAISVVVNCVLTLLLILNCFCRVTIQEAFCDCWKRTTCPRDSQIVPDLTDKELVDAVKK